MQRSSASAHLEQRGNIKHRSQLSSSDYVLLPGLRTLQKGVFVDTIAVDSLEDMMAAVK